MSLNKKLIALGFESHSVSRWLRGKNRPRPLEAKRLARATGLKFELLLFGEMNEIQAALHSDKVAKKLRLDR